MGDIKNQGISDEGMRDDGLIPSGIQVAKAMPDSVTFGAASTDTEQIGVLFRITKGPHAGRTLPWYGSMSDKAKDRTLEQLVLAGCTFPDGDLTNMAGLGSKEIEVQVECDEVPEGENAGQMRSRITWLGVGIAMSKMFDKDQKKAFANKYKGDVVALKKRLGIGGKSESNAEAKSASK